MLNAKKKFGIGLTLAGMALLLLAFLSIPFAWEMRIRWLLLGGGILLPVVAACIMWQEGIHNLRQAGKPAGGYLHVMRQSGFFDLVVGMLILALVLGMAPCPPPWRKPGCSPTLWSITSSRT